MRFTCRASFNRRGTSCKEFSTLPSVFALSAAIQSLAENSRNENSSSELTFREKSTKYYLLFGKRSGRRDISLRRDKQCTVYYRYVATPNDTRIREWKRFCWQYCRGNSAYQARRIDYLFIIRWNLAVILRNERCVLLRVNYIQKGKVIDSCAYYDR